MQARLHNPAKAEAAGLGWDGLTHSCWLHGALWFSGSLRGAQQRPFSHPLLAAFWLLQVEHSQGPVVVVVDEEEEASPWLLARASSSSLDLGAAEAAEPVRQGEAGRLGTSRAAADVVAEAGSDRPCWAGWSRKGGRAGFEV